MRLKHLLHKYLHHQKRILCAVLTFTALCASAKDSTVTLPQSPPPLSVVEAEVAQAQKDFEIAKKLFNPWYAGPLLTGSAQNIPPGHFNIQPYLFVTTTYAQFGRDRKSRSISNIVTVNPVFVYQMGWFSWLDFSVILSALYNQQAGQKSAYLGDTQMNWGIPLMVETPYHPALRFSVFVTFPTGRYNHLNPTKNGIDATGAGSYQTTLSVNMSKVFWQIPTHPFRLRFAFNYTIPSTVQVRRFNAYGGGFGTRGRVRPGNFLEVDSSIEWSFTKKWVLAVDFVYTYGNHATFSGYRGVNTDGSPARIGAPSSESFSIAPAIEYNPTHSLGILAGGWVALTGRNADRFAAGIITATYYW